MISTNVDKGSQEQDTPTKTGIKVVIVGAGETTSMQKSRTALTVGKGFGGLTAAIECHRRGHDVSIYESFIELKVLGDIISFGSNAGRIFRRWHYKSGDRVSDRLRPLSIDLRNHGFDIYKWTGEFVINQPSPKADPEAPVFNGHRGELHTVVFEYARDELGIPIHLGKRIQKYFEDDKQAGIVLEDGEKVHADVVIGSDGVRSKARELVLGYDDRPKASGYAVFRAWFPNTDMMADPRTRKFCEHGDTFQGWIGPDVHFLFSTIKGGKDCCWVMTHRDDKDIEESWSLPGNMEDVYKVIDGWDPLCKAIVEKTPSCVDWKLVYRDPLSRWVSDNGRTSLLGDSAHPFLPTSAQGATQAMEDGVTLAYCLRVAGKAQIPAALRAFQDIRYERVKAVQKTGETTRDMWHKADWDRVKEDPKSVQMPREDWIHGHDAETHVSQVFQDSFNKFVPSLLV
ncbi:putative MAK1-like monooxygenase [Aureobasidium pullulans]|uniref:Putative MAK1-like monooxygenase n=1 Tax=Aureobasidium pullulans TaxID=5580 RepID=A0A4S8YQP9_AURPU|nr:putative MAK1-like monooxygenase [Aureobasidium pullulans]